MSSSRRPGRVGPQSAATRTRSASFFGPFVGDRLYRVGRRYARLSISSRAAPWLSRQPSTVTDADSCDFGRRARSSVTSGLCEDQARYFRRRVARGASRKRSRGLESSRQSHFAGSADLNGGEARREVKGAKGALRTIRYAFVQLRLKPARFNETRDTGDDLHRTVHVGLPANARKQTMAPPSNHRR